MINNVNHQFQLIRLFLNTGTKQIVFGIRWRILDSYEKQYYSKYRKQGQKSLEFQDKDLTILEKGKYDIII